MSPDYETTDYITGNMFFLLCKTVPSLTVLYKLITSVVLTCFKSNIKTFEYCTIAALIAIFIIETLLVFLIDDDEISFYCDLAMVIFTIAFTII